MNNCVLNQLFNFLNSFNFIIYLNYDFLFLIDFFYLLKYDWDLHNFFDDIMNVLIYFHYLRNNLFNLNNFWNFDDLFLNSLDFDNFWHDIDLFNDLLYELLSNFYVLYDLFHGYNFLNSCRHFLHFFSNIWNFLDNFLNSGIHNYLLNDLWNFFKLNLLNMLRDDLFYYLWLSDHFFDDFSCWYNLLNDLFNWHGHFNWYWDSVLDFNHLWDIN